MALPLIPIALAALGTFSAVNTYNAQRDQAKSIAENARLKRQSEAEQIRLDSLAESEKVNAQRDKNRRLRDNMLAQYAQSGVLIDGSSEDILVKQREVDELNIQRVHDRGNNQRSLDNWKSNSDLQQSLYTAKSMKKGAKIGLFTNLATTGLSFGINTGAFSNSGLMGSTPNTFSGPNTMAGQTLNMNYFNSVV